MKKTILCLILFYTSFQPLESHSKPNEDRGVAVLMYHRFDGRYPSTSVTKELLEQHIMYLKKEGFQFVTLDQVFEGIQKLDGSTPIRSTQKRVAITIDDAFLSAYTVAHPLLKKHNIPYTLFVNTQAIEEGIKDYMSWKQLEEVAQSKVGTLEVHGHAHAFMIRKMNKKQREEDIKKSVKLIYEHSKRIPKYFAYPYGEVSRQSRQELIDFNTRLGDSVMRFKGAFSTQSGNAGYTSDRFRLPRFAVNMKYGQLGPNLKNKLNSWHFPVQNFSPFNRSSFCTSEEQKKFALQTKHLNLKNLQCFASNGSLKINLSGKTKADIILEKPFSKVKSHESKRDRINCTMPKGKGEFYWLGNEFSILDC